MNSVVNKSLIEFDIYFCGWVSDAKSRIPKEDLREVTIECNHLFISEISHKMLQEPEHLPKFGAKPCAAEMSFKEMWRLYNY